MGALSLSDATTLESHNPATGELVGRVPVLDAQAVRAVVERARAAQAAWGALPVRDRAERVAGLRDQIVRRADEICQRIQQECGKPHTEALTTEVAVVVDWANYFVRRAPDMLRPETIRLHLLKTRRSYLHHVPRGVVGLIASWSLPFAIPMCETVMALLAGNAVVLKPSEATPLVALLAKEIHDASGLPPDLFQVVPGPGETGAALIDAGIDYCLFTGSTATGRKVAAACGERLIPYVLKLSSKAAAIVCADADLERTARALTWGAFCNSGQVCGSVERAYVHEDIHDALIDRIVAEVGRLRQGDPALGEVDLGSMTCRGRRDIVRAQVQRAIAQGATARTGGSPQQGPGLFFPPTVLTGCHQDMEIMREEIFGPVLPIMRVSSEEEAVELTNASRLGLVGYVFTRDVARGRRLAERLCAGTVMVNDVLLTLAAPETPWAGVGEAGNGWRRGAQGLRDLCQLRHVNYDRITLRQDPWWFPYRDRLYKRVLRWLRYLFR
ncbi:MAG: aldehyde dehydrogenase family protein [Myxococcales bacterium]|nr:aldehyde dehydrogenase family protein [Myxococcota bacterium]MDW8280972.1 aldehyde dehydrogenase family protein [Myxococcales bacterium]